MATYTELHDLFNGESELRNKIAVACAIKAADIVANIGTATAGEKAWAKEVFDNPSTMANKVLMFVIADNSSLSVAQITGATDAAIQTKVDTSVVLFGE